MMASALQQGIAAAKAGRKSEARQLLLEATTSTGTAENAWLWLSGVVERDEERLFCLDNALQINPNNEPARFRANSMRQKGIFPTALEQSTFSSPTRNEAHPVLLDPFNPGGSKLAEAAAFSSPSFATASSVSVGAGKSNSQKGIQDLTGVYKMAAEDLARNKSTSTIMKSMVDQGLSKETAQKIIAEMQGALKNSRKDKYRRQMVRGLLWTMAGSLVTCGSYWFANDLGGIFMLCWGAILIGVLDFFLGFVRWLAAT
jgi:hypothetical protein